MTACHSMKKNIFGNNNNKKQHPLVLELVLNLCLTFIFELSTINTYNLEARARSAILLGFTIHAAYLGNTVVCSFFFHFDIESP